MRLFFRSLLLIVSYPLVNNGNRCLSTMFTTVASIETEIETIGKDVLDHKKRTSTTCSHPVAIMDWRGVFSARVSASVTIFRSWPLIHKYLSLIDGIRQISKLSLNICTYSKGFPSESRQKHYASR